MNNTLDIILTHYDEPWELGKPFFDMLENQRLADMDQISVIIVQDGKENTLDWHTLLSPYHINTRVLTIPHSGPATARNVGLKHASAEWVMFFNFDDRFADVCSLSMIFDQFPTNDCDIIWCKIVREQKWYTNTIYMNCIDNMNFTSTDGKLYRTSVLRDNHVTFPQIAKHKYMYAYVFNAILLAIVPPWRIAMLTTSFYPVYKTFRPDSYKHTLPAMLTIANGAFVRDVSIADMYRARGYTSEFKRTMVKAIIDHYYTLYDPSKNPNPARTFPPELLQYYDENRMLFLSMSNTEIETIADEVEIESSNNIQFLYNEHKQELYFLFDNIKLEAWLDKLDATVTGKEITPVKSHSIIPVSKLKQSATLVPNYPRVVVYCGTSDVYMNMVASCKSLLAMTPVDKVYFLIEDDTFPYELPNIVKTINIKPTAQLLYDQHGPNYNNSWTYMCLVRSAFPEIFKEYDRILSLDIDVVINDNISDIWNYDLTDYYLAGVPERQRQKSPSDPLYINFGVVLMNLKKLREDNMPKKITDALNTQKFGCPEQDAYNKFCAYHILDIPNDFNATAHSHITGDAQKERIIHYAGKKYWRHYSSVKQYSDLDWDTIMSRQKQLKEGEHHAQ